MVLWTIALLAGIVLLLAGVIEGWLTEETREGKQFRARQQALSGIAVAMNPAVLPGDPLLEAKGRDPEEGYKVVILDESGLINPNGWLTPDQRQLFGKLFTSWGLDKNACDTAADGLFDWQSRSPFRSLRGAKQPEYAAAGRPGLPPNAPFVSPGEMELVLGFDPVRTAKPDWAAYFTTYYSGKVNLLHAPKRILTDLIGLTPPQADAWIALRNGKDGIEGTEDDLMAGTVSQAADLMGANAVQRAVMDATCDVQGSVRRIESTGFCHGVTHRIIVITGNAQAGGAVLGWTEQ